MNLDAVLRKLTRPKVLVLGDLILDRYTTGNAERVSQEAPIVVLRAEDQEERLGGAANVCHMLRGLEATVTCAGLVGDDDGGRTVRKLLKQVKVDADLVLTDPARPTTVKERFIGQATGSPGQLLRVDREVQDPLSRELAEELVAGLRQAVFEHDIVLISDYAKGVCTPFVCRRLIDAAQRAGVPVLVDPRRTRDHSRYRGATLLKPNRTETELAIDGRLEDARDVFHAGKLLCQELDLQMVVVTLDREGMALIHHDGRSEIFPTQARSVFDITGAGDMVLAALAAGIGGGAHPDEAVALANIAAGLEVEKQGVAIVSKSELTAAVRQHAVRETGKTLELGPLVHEVAAQRQRGKRIVFTNGCFDLLHVGHVSYLAEAAALGDVLIVGINSDDSVRRLKGPQRPIINETDRAAVLAALGCVDHVIVFDEDTPHHLLRALEPDVLVKGGTYSSDEVVGKEVVEAYGGEVRVTNAINGVSTTEILKSAHLRKAQAA